MEMAEYSSEEARSVEKGFSHLPYKLNKAVYKFLSRNEGVVAEHKNFEILETGLKNKVTRKLAESLYIKEYNPDLNVRARSYKLILFN